MKVIVTGSSGLIGRWVCGYLSELGYEITGVDKRAPDFSLKGLTHADCDILDYSRLEEIFCRALPEGLIHLAARTDLDETESVAGYAANIQGIRNVLQAVEKAGSVRRAIYTSSQLVCRVGYIPENMQDYCPNTLYGESKVLTEKLVSELDGGRTEWCIARPTTVWGPHMSAHYQRLLHLIRKGLYFHCGKSKLYKSYSYAGNIAFQYFKLLTVPADKIHGRTFYLADYEPLSLRDYANGLAEEMGSPRIPDFPKAFVRVLALFGDLINKLGFSGFPFNSFRLNNILTSYVFDLSETRTVCGELPFSQADGIRATARWFLENVEKKA